MKDYSQYFKGPSLKDAKHRGKDEIHHIKDAYEIPADMVGIGQGQKVLLFRHMVAKLMNVIVKLWQVF